MNIPLCSLGQIRIFSSTLLFIQNIYAQDIRNLHSNETSEANILYFKEGIQLINQHQDYREEHEKYFDISFQLEMKGSYDATIYWLKKITDDHKIPKEVRAAAHRGISKIKHTKGDYIGAIKESQQSIDLSDNELSKAKSKLFIVGAYMGIFDYEHATKILNESLNTFIKYKDSLSLAMAFKSLSAIHASLHQYDSALTLSLLAYSYLKDKNIFELKSQKDKEIIATCRAFILNNLSDLYLKLQLPDSAAFYLQRAEQDFDYSTEYLKSVIFLTYGDTYTLLMQPNVAMQYYKKALNMAEKHHIHEVKTYAFKVLAKAYANKKITKKHGTT